MQSEAENQSQKSAPAPERPLANDIGRSLQDGDSILDFVARNTPGQVQPNSAGEVIQADVDKMAEEKNPDTVITAPEPEPEVVPDVTVEEEEQPPSEAPQDTPEEGEPASDDDTVEDDVELKGTTAENFKNLRTKVKELKTESVDKDKLLTELTKELEAYSKGEKIPEELEKREARIAELEQYEKILNLKKSRYYQDNFVKPLDGITKRLDKLASDYNIDPQQLRQAANLQNEADLNRFLSSNFDAVGAGDVKAIVREYKQLQAAAIVAEKEPAKALNEMIESAKEARSKAQVERLEVMQDVTRDAWKESLDYIKDEGKIRELMYQEGDVEHNSKVFTPIVQAAASEYGKLVNQLVKNGLEALPKELATALSRLCQLAHASAVAIDSRERAVSMAEQIENNSKRTQRHIRPSVSGKIDAGKTARNGMSGPSSPMEAAEKLLQQVRGR